MARGHAITHIARQCSGNTPAYRRRIQRRKHAISSSTLGSSGIEYLPGDSAGILPHNPTPAVDRVLKLLQFSGDEPVKDFYGIADQRARRAHLLAHDRQALRIHACAPGPHNRNATGWQSFCSPAPRKSSTASSGAASSLTCWKTAPREARGPAAALQDSAASCAAPLLHLIQPGVAPKQRRIFPSAWSAMRATGAIRLGVCSGQIGERTPDGRHTCPFSSTPTRIFGCPPIRTRASSWLARGLVWRPSAPIWSTSRRNAAAGPCGCSSATSASSAGLSLPGRTAGMAEVRHRWTGSIRPSPATRHTRSTCRTASAKTPRSCGAGWTQGAYFYVCGDSKRMAPDVEAAMLKAIADHSGKGPDYANEFLAGMKKQKRYLRDIY